MQKKIYVGNLPFNSTEEQIRQLFEQHGTVESVTLVTDRETGRLRGFGFVEMDQAGAEAAIKALDNTEVDGRTLKVSEARERRERRPRRSW